jgi:hypothetical protein
MNVPAYLLSSEDNQSMTYSNVQDERKQYYALSIEPYVQGFAFKPDSGKLMNSGAGGANLNIRFNNGGKVSQDAMRLAVMHKQLRKHHG